MENLEFKSKINSGNIRGLLKYYKIEDFNVDIDVLGNLEFEIIYKLVPQYKSWGISSIDPVYKSIKSQIELYLPIENLEENIIQEIEKRIGQKRSNSEVIEWVLSFDTSNPGWSFTSSVGFEENGRFIIGYIEVDFATKTIEVS